MKRLRILLDLRHPLACLALQPALALADSLSDGADWLPLEVSPLKPPGIPKDGDQRGVRHFRYRAEAIAREIETYSRIQGIILREPYRNGSVEAGHLGWLWVREREPERLTAYLQALFRGYWSLELDASDPEQVASLVDSFDADGASFQSWVVGEGPKVAAATQSELRDEGLFRVPGFVVDGEPFYGRQHIPMLRWILDGRSGPIPI
ncbi:MAG: hypothetical protein JRG95_14270 [Deltaproteobacteria bacterium]|nr:hypothetical protein [Deltaproteobacteria bacterium]